MEDTINTESQDGESDMDCSDDDYDYYDITDDNDIEQIDPSQTDPEYFNYECLTEEQVERLLNETVELLSNNLQITPSLAKVLQSSTALGPSYCNRLIFQVLLHTHRWNVSEITAKYRENASQLLINSKVKPSLPPAATAYFRYLTCPVCVMPHTFDKFGSLTCAHLFCKECWTTHFEVQINQVSLTYRKLLP